ncbi:alkene reductase [Aspergillus undulatus]|uniref:alkene reductase n=1 Tax=Aspergillus undulatus TaxID=1810928 RepID=UPI003CCCFE3A
MATTSKLFTPLKVGSLTLSHRITLPPMTRFRVEAGHIPQEMVAEYYAQRASEPGTLLITEAILISTRPGVYEHVPGIWNEDQIKRWRTVTDAVHAKGSYIFAQLWALGRVADPAATKADAGPDAQVISSSAVPFGEGGVVPKEMTEDDIQAVIADYATAAKNAIAAGFDGVEIHGANGYLVDQFIQRAVNKRTDAWGGSVENRARFPLSVIKAVVDAIGAERTAIRYSPWGLFQGMGVDPADELIEQFGYVARKTAEFGLAFVHLVEARIAGNTETEETGGKDLGFFFEAYGKASPIMVAGGYVGETAREAADEQYKGYDVLVAIGRPWIANPDLPFRVKRGIPLRPYEREHFYTVRSPVGYIDYEFSEEFKAAAAAA